MISMPSAEDGARPPVQLDGLFMVPGLVNAQTHAFHVLMRGFIDDLRVGLVHPSVDRQLAGID